MEQIFTGLRSLLVLTAITVDVDLLLGNFFSNEGRDTSKSSLSIFAYMIVLYIELVLIFKKCLSKTY